MSTRSVIGRVNKDNSVDVIYCHYDGYPKYNGRILNDYYSYPGAVDNILALGNLSFLDVRLNPIGEHSFDKPEKGTTVAYHRDRGDKLCKPMYYNSIEDCINNVYGDCWAEYVYLWFDDCWHCYEI